MNTSYYSNVNLYKLSNLVSVSCRISGSTAKRVSEYKQFRNIRGIDKFKPSWDKLVGPYRSGKLSQDDYTDRYNEQLYNLNVHEFIDLVGLDAILLCYELPNTFCHRHILSNWITTESNICCTEYYELQQNVISEAFLF